MGLVFGNALLDDLFFAWFGRARGFPIGREAFFWMGGGFPIGREAFFWMRDRGAELFDLPGVAFVEKGKLLSLIHI